MHKTSTLIECVERKLLDERQAVNLDVVALGSKLDLLYFLTTDDWTNVWLVDAYDTIRNALLGTVTLVMLSLLTVCLCNRLYFCKLLIPCFRYEVRFATDFSAWYRVSQTESYGHLMQRKEGMKASELTLFERLFIIFVKIELYERKTWCYFRNLLYLRLRRRYFRTFVMTFFSFPPKQALQSSLGDFL